MSEKHEQDASPPDEHNLLFVRSPHPYSRSSYFAPNELPVDGDTPSPTSRAYAEGYSRLDSRLDPEPIVSREDSVHDSSSEEESGLSAGLKLLPAPPLALRKGLRRADGSVDPPTPGLRPSQTPSHDEVWGEGGQQLHSGRIQVQVRRESLVQRIKKLDSRERGLIFRRILEVGLGCAPLIAWWNAITTRTSADEALQERANISHSLSEPAHANLPNLEALSFLAIALSLWYGFLGLSSVVRLLRSGTESLPQADPSVFLYPILLPLLVGRSASSSSMSHDLVNFTLVLGHVHYHLGAYPLGRGSAAVPWIWTLSLVPIWLARSQISKLNLELYTLLYPLHLCLTSTLRNLTTSSLMETEVQLLATGLINLLMSARSPQAIICQALLWIGGLSMLTMCGSVLQWIVAIARIPRERFRRPGELVSSKHPLLQAFEDAVETRNTSFLVEAMYLDSSAGPYQQRPQGSSRALSTRGVDANPSSPSHPPMSTHTDITVRPGIKPNGRADSVWKLQRPPAFRPPRRRHTLANGAASSTQSSYGTPSQATRIPKALRSNKYLALTAKQANARIWIYSVYVYSVIALVILGFIRYYVSIFALRGEEPITWALQYLFADIQESLSRSEHPKSSWLLSQLRSANQERYRTIGISGDVLIDFWLSNAVGECNVRLVIIAYWLLVFMIGLGTVLQIRSRVEIDTRRKVFHGTIVAMLLPTTFIDPAFVALVLSLVLAIFLTLDLLRASQVPPIAKPLAIFLEPFVDGRDSQGPIVVSHMFLLIGCAIPLWLSLASIDRLTTDSRFQGWNVSRREVAMVSGIICVGLGDAAASLVGRRYGRHRWIWGGGKSLEGSLAFAIAVAISLTAATVWLRFGWSASASTDEVWVSMVKIAVAAVGSSLTEAVLTGANDNVVVPVILWILVKQLAI